MNGLDAMMTVTGIDRIREEHLIGIGLTLGDHMIEMIGIDLTHGEHSIEMSGIGIGIGMTRITVVIRTDGSDPALVNVPVVHLRPVLHLYHPLLLIRAQTVIIQRLPLPSLHPLRHP
jgi:hypothetical protein